MRADQLLVERQLASSRSQAQRLIAAGVQWRLPGAAWQPVRKNGDELPPNAELQLQDEAEARYVSRGGLKLESALAQVGLDVTGLRCLDVGQSTGGFTDCLLQHGAAQVTGLDVGQGQLHSQLRADARVTAHEKVNARDPEALAAVLKEAFDLLVGDLSFISQTLVLPAVLAWLKPGGQLLMLAAYKRVAASTLGPLNYLQLLLVVAISAFWFGQVPDVLTLAGTALVAAAGLYLVWPRR